MKVWLQYFIDAATGFTLVSVIRSKDPSVIIEKITLLWVVNGLGVSKRYH